MPALVVTRYFDAMLTLDFNPVTHDHQSGLELGIRGLCRKRSLSLGRKQIFTLLPSSQADTLNLFENKYLPS